MSDSFAKVILASVSPQGIPLVTVHLRYWRGIHSELMTHRAFSRNARSSRAVPVAKMLEEIRNDPFIPRHWGKNQKGMQAGEELGPIERSEARAMWLTARNRAMEQGEKLMELGLHKQVANRLLEPFMWIDTLVTSTDWANFFALRDHKDAEPHFRDLAQLTKEAIKSATFQKLDYHQWHLPYITSNDLRMWAGDGPGDSDIAEAYDIARKVSAARCARISYAPFDGIATVPAELDRYNKLIENWPVHASPVEHQAVPDSIYKSHRGVQWNNLHQHRNFRGWRQFRAMIKGETTWDNIDTDEELVG